MLGNPPVIAVACANSQVRCFKPGLLAPVAVLSDAFRLPEARILRGPTFGRTLAGVVTLAASPDQKWLAAGFDHGVVQVWSADSLQVVARRICPKLSALEFSLDGNSLAIGTFNHRVFLLDLRLATDDQIARLREKLPAFNVSAQGK